MTWTIPSINDDTNIVVIGGPTASGKSQMAFELASKLDAEIVNADSMQVYEELPIITAQPEDSDVQHHLYGFLPAKHACSVGIWLDHTKDAIQSILDSNKKAIVVGGTGMYIKALEEGIAEIPEVSDKVKAMRKSMDLEDIYAELKEHDLETWERVPANDRQRIWRAWEVWKETGKAISEWHKIMPIPPFPETKFQTFALIPDREWLYPKCDERFDAMLENGAIEEVEHLMEQNLPPTLPAMKALGVPEIIAYLNQQMDLNEAAEKAKQYTRNYAKRQLTWFNNSFEGEKIFSAR